VAFISGRWTLKEDEKLAAAIVLYDTTDVHALQGCVEGRSNAQITSQ
jgi:hypothetical protein